MKSEAMKDGKNPAKTIIAELTKPKTIVDKTCHGLDSYYKGSIAKQSIDFTIIEPSPSSSNNIPNDKLIPQKELNKSLSQSCLEISLIQLNIDTPLVEIFSVKRLPALIQTSSMFVGNSSKDSLKILHTITGTC